MRGITRKRSNKLAAGLPGDFTIPGDRLVGEDCPVVFYTDTTRDWVLLSEILPMSEYMNRMARPERNYILADYESLEGLNLKALRKVGTFGSSRYLTFESLGEALYYKSTNKIKQATRVVCLNVK